MNTQIKSLSMDDFLQLQEDIKFKYFAIRNPEIAAENERFIQEQKQKEYDDIELSLVMESELLDE